MKTLNGKKPVSEKPQSTLKYSTYQANALDIPPGIQEELKSKNLEGRWINYKRYTDDGFFHKEGWIPYKPDKQDVSNGLHYGNNVDGIIRRREMVLASRPSDVCESHREYLKEKTRRQNGRHKSALSKEARDSGFNTSVFEDTDNEE